MIGEPSTRAMPVQQCPYCHAPLKIPRKRIEHPVDCPRCRRRFLVAAADSAKGAPPASPAARAPTSPPGAAERAIPPPALGHEAPPAPATVSRPPLAPNGPPPSAEATATVRIVRPKPAATVLHPSTEGKLPELRLSEQPARNAPDLSTIKSNPIVLALLFALSFASSAVMLLIDFDPTPRDIRNQAEARAKLRDFWEAKPGAAVQPYQFELRQAQQAHSRGDYAAERAGYRKVMNRLLAEDRNPYVGLTGSPTRDLELQSHLSLLLGDEQSPMLP